MTSKETYVMWPRDGYATALPRSVDSRSMSRDQRKQSMLMGGALDALFDIRYTDSVRTALSPPLLPITCPFCFFRVEKDRCSNCGAPRGERP